MAAWVSGVKRFFSLQNLQFLAGKRIKPALQIGFSVGAVLCILVWLPAFPSYENKTLDWRYTWKPLQAAAPSDKVVIVAIDDQSLETLKVQWPWPRTMYAKAIDNLSKAGAKVVALDFVFSEPSKKELAAQDKVLGDAIVRSRSWIVMANKLSRDETQSATRLAVESPIASLDPGKTHVGFVNVWYDPDGILRRSAVVQRRGKVPYYSFALKIISRWYGLADPPYTTSAEEWLHYGPLSIPVQKRVNLLVNYRGGAGSFKTISFENILDDEVFAGMLTTGVFKDKIVLIGPTFAEAQDNHPTPYIYGYMPGVEVHANVIDTILHQKYFHFFNDLRLYLLMLLLPTALALIIIHLKPLKGLLFYVFFTIAYFSVGIWVFAHGRWIIPLFNPLLALTITYLVVFTYRVLTEEKRSRQIKGMFSRYVSPKVVDELIKNPSAALKLGGEKQEVTVLFSDIRGFTTLSEQLQPEQVVELLNEYFQAMTDVIFAHDGMVDKFIGDAIMAIFGAPVPHPDDPLRAVQTAVAMQAELKKLQEKWAARGRRTFEIGVGVNTGEAIVGNMGSTQAMGYTVIGDTVNLASRLESANKELATHILISESTYRRVAGQVEAKEHEGIKVKGKANAMSVFEVLRLK